jgi:hypothetical protein
MRARRLAFWVGASLIPTACAVVLLVPPAPRAASAPPLGKWQGSVVVFRDGVLRNRVHLDLTINSLRVGRIAARATWRDPPVPPCTDILRLKRKRPGRWWFSVAATVGACAGTSWIYDISRRDSRRLRMRGTSNLPQYRSRVYVGTLVRSA